jgi:hypothetical protein
MLILYVPNVLQINAAALLFLPTILSILAKDYCPFLHLL